MSVSTTQVTYQRIRTNGVSRHVCLTGPAGGEPAVLLHGFPDAWVGWAPQIAALAEAGLRVIPPNQRGYSLSDKPRGVAAYRMAQLVDDVLGPAGALGYDSFCLAGHDRGAAVAWSVAMEHPARVRRLDIATVPHPDVMGRHLRTGPVQRRRSRYMFFCQLPWLPEMVARRVNGAC